jgi:hypothetical protein
MGQPDGTQGQYATNQTYSASYDPNAPVIITGEGVWDWYQAVEYLSFTGTQVIDTGVDNQGDNKKLEVVANSTNHTANNSKAPAGSGSTSNSSFRIGKYTGNQFIYHYRNSGTVLASPAFVKDTYYTLTTEIAGTAYKASIDGAVVAEKTETGVLGVSDFFIGGHSPTNLWTGNVKSVKIWKDDALVADFVPVCPAGALTSGCGMLELVTKKFFGNEGTGDLAGGNALGEYYTLDGDFIGDSQPTVTVKFGTDVEITAGGGVDCASVTVLSPTEITCLPGAYTGALDTLTDGSRGKRVKVAVEVGGTATTSADELYTYRAPMALAAVNPRMVDAAGGTEITLSGTNFSPIGLPSGYAPIDHVTFTGTQVLDTGVDNQGSLKLEVVASSTNNTANNSKAPAGSGSTINSSFRIGKYTDNRFIAHFYNSGRIIDSPSFNQDVYYKLTTELAGTAYTASIDDVVVYAEEKTQVLELSTLYVGGYSPDNLWRGNIKSAKIWKAGVLVRDYLPAVEVASGKIGFFDLVNGVWSATGTADVTGNLGNVSSANHVSSVLVDGQNCAITAYSSAEIRCRTPAHATGLVDVVVNNNYERIAEVAAQSSPEDSPTAGLLYIEVFLSLATLDGATDHDNDPATPAVPLIAFDCSPGLDVCADYGVASATTNNPAGYSLTLEANGSELVCQDDAELAIPSRGGLPAEDALGTSEWGWNYQTAFGAAPTLWREVPHGSAFDITAAAGFGTSPSGPSHDGSAADDYYLWYGAKVGWTVAACVYQQTFVVTMAAR